MVLSVYGSAVYGRIAGTNHQLQLISKAPPLSARISR